MQFPVMDSAGREVSQVELPADIFEAKINVGLMHQASRLVIAPSE